LAQSTANKILTVVLGSFDWRLVLGHFNVRIVSRRTSIRVLAVLHDKKWPIRDAKPRWGSQACCLVRNNEQMLEIAFVDAGE